MSEDPSYIDLQQVETLFALADDALYVNRDYKKAVSHDSLKIG